MEFTTVTYTLAIDSSSRDIKSYPDRAAFRFKLPETYKNVISVKNTLLVLPNFPGALDVPYITLNIDELRDPKYILSQNTYTQNPFAIYPMCKACNYKPDIRIPPPFPCEPQPPPPPPCSDMENYSILLPQSQCKNEVKQIPLCCGDDELWGWVCFDKTTSHEYTSPIRQLEYLTIRLVNPDGTIIQLGKDNIKCCNPKIYSQWLLVLEFTCKVASLDVTNVMTKTKFDCFNI
jgi:hypothetical protein